MTIFLILLLVVGLFGVFSIRHFFVQVVALKLSLDALLLIVVGQAREPLAANYYGFIWLLGSIGASLFFVLLVASIRRFSRTRTLDLEADHD